ncbi:MAG: T9SS type A sorting domain-containing protein [Bacteroidales bacterium]|nr:T9SS type A sorting domain-containing protein [Bacteroidales bacterium]
MKTLFTVLLSIFILISAIPAMALVSGYKFSQSTKAYSSASGTVYSFDYGYNEIEGVEIGFTFRFNDVDFTTISFNTDGFACFGDIIFTSGSVIASGISQNVIAPCNGDLWGTPNCNIITELSGTSPNRVFTIEWSDFDFFGGPADVMNFQIRLYETSNKIDVIYGNFVIYSKKRETVQVGLKGWTGLDYSTRWSYTSWVNSDPGYSNGCYFYMEDYCYPPSGLCFTWEPPDEEVNFGGGGPFSGGYYFANSVPGSGAPSQPTYGWVSEQSNEVDPGSVQGIGLNNGWWGPVDMPFAINFYDQSCSSIYVTTEGFVTFSPDPVLASNTYIPGKAEPNNYIAICWDNMAFLDGATHIYYGGNDDMFMVTYHHLYSSEGTGDQYLTAQVIIRPNGIITVQYNDQESSGNPDSYENDCTIGLENADGTLGLQYRYNGSGGPMFGSPMAVAFGKDANALAIEKQNPLAENAVTIFPNPGNDHIYISTRLRNVLFILSDMTGQKVLEESPGNGHAVYTGNLPGGIYIFSVYLNGKLVQAGKWEKEE